MRRGGLSSGKSNLNPTPPSAEAAAPRPTGARSRGGVNIDYEEIDESSTRGSVLYYSSPIAR